MGVVPVILLVGVVVIVYILEPDLNDIRHSLLADRGLLQPSPEEKRNSYLSFEGGYDHGKPDG